MSNLNDNVTVGIRYGIMSGSIKEQIDAQGHKYDEKQIANLERQKEAIHVLSFGGLLTDSMRDKLFQKLHKKLMSHLAKMNKMSVVK